MTQPMKIISVALTKDRKIMLDALAVKKECSTSCLIRYAIDKMLEAVEDVEDVKMPFILPKPNENTLNKGENND